MTMLKIEPPIHKGSKKRAGAHAITLAILDVVADALVEGDADLLERLNVTPAMAKLFFCADRKLLADLIAKSQGALRVEFDSELLEDSMSTAYSTGIADLWRRQLIDLGATFEILQELGIGVSRHVFADLMRTSPPEIRQCYNGRPKDLTPDEARSIHTMCECMPHPERLHPIEHLINTSRLLDIRIAGIWRYLHSLAQSQDTRPYQRHMWIYQLFPRWESSEATLTRLPEKPPSSDYMRNPQSISYGPTNKVQQFADRPYT